MMYYRRAAAAADPAIFPSGVAAKPGRTGHQAARRSRGAADPMRRRAIAGVARAQLEADAIAAGPGNAATRGWT